MVSINLFWTQICTVLSKLLNYKFKNQYLGFLTKIGIGFQHFKINLSCAYLNLKYMFGLNLFGIWEVVWILKPKYLQKTVFYV